MLSVALTGSVGSGKSEVARFWREAGVPVVSADELSREAVAVGSEGLAEVRRAFGDRMLGPDGSLDRTQMRALVFADEGARKRLESILHPRIAALREEWIAARRAEGHALVVSEIPLLFEAGLEGEYDLGVVVDAAEGTRLRRLVEKRGLGEDEARRIMAAQMEPAQKRARADHVLANDGSLNDLRRAALALLDQLRAGDWETPGGGRGGHLRPGSNSDLRIDFHMHCCRSHDCLSLPEDVLAAARRRGVNRIALTDHNKLDVALLMAERHPDAIIPAEEVRTSEGIDVIGLYMSEEIPKRTPAREVCDLVHAQGGLVYLPHPYAAGKGGDGKFAEELAPHMDIIEVFNGRLHDPEQNAKALDLAQRHAKPHGAGSDAHTLGEVASCWVELPLHRNDPAALMKALRFGRVHGTTAGRWVHLASTWAKVRHKLPGAPRPF